MRTYELIRIVVMRSHPTYAIAMADTKEREVTVAADEIQENPRLWALVYNGIRHSVANGAQCEGKETRKILHLGPPS